MKNRSLAAHHADQQTRLYSIDSGMMITHNVIDDPTISRIVSLSVNDIVSGWLWLGSIPRRLLCSRKEFAQYGDYFSISEITEIYRQCYWQYFFGTKFPNINKDISLFIRSTKSMGKTIIHPISNRRPLKKIFIDRMNKHVHMIDQADPDFPWLITMTFSELCLISELVIDFLKKHKEGPLCQKRTATTGGCISAKISGHLSSTGRSKKAAEKDSTKSS